MLTAEVFRALADPTRRAVFECLTDREMSVSQLTAGFTVSQPAISQHLAALKRARLVSERRTGRHAYYQATPDALAPLHKWMQRYGNIWPARIEKLKGVLKEMDR